MNNNSTLSSDFEIYKIDGGEVFEGTWTEFQLAYGTSTIETKEELIEFCEDRDYKLEVIKPTVH